MAGRPNPVEPLLKLAGIIVACAVLAAGLALPYVGGLGLLAGKQANKFMNTKCNLIESPPPQKTVLFAKDGTTQLATLFTYDREVVKLSQVPKYLQRALIATEDRRFYSHHGVDMRGLIRSAVSSSGGDTQGGSTLTMQYVKQVRYYQADTDAEREAAISQTLTRKMEDAKCALDIEKHDSKDEILAKYLNIAFFGENSYGIGVAARNFFGKDVSKLTLPEAALLVGVVKAPTEFDPFVPANRKAAIERRNQVIQNLADVGDISQAKADEYKATALSLATTSQQAIKQGCAGANANIHNAGFFCDYVTDWLENQAGVNAKTINTGGLKIITTIDPTLQNTVQTSLWNQLTAKSRTTSIMPIVDPHTGDVLAMATSKKYGLADDGEHTTVPIFTNASAGGGSTYKLFSLLAALKTGVPTDFPLSNTDDTSYTVQHCDTDPPYVAKNDSEGTGFTRTETLSSATAKSSNTYFVALEDQLYQDCDLSPIVNTALGLGMSALNVKDPQAARGTYAQNVLSQQQATFTLGPAPTSPLQITGAYASLANDGKFCPPAPVTSIRDANGHAIDFKRTPCSVQMTPEVARTALQVLNGDTHVGGTSAQQFQSLYAANPALSVAGKTGTVNASDAHGQLGTNADLWFVGVTPDLVATTAMFNIDNSTKQIVSIPGMLDKDAGHLTGAYAAGVWANALAPVLQGKQWQWPDPNAIQGVVQVPSVIGQTYDSAKAQLTGAGFKVVKFPIFCGSAQVYGNVAYQSAPQTAEPGSTITLCVSNGQAPFKFVPPPPKPKPSKTPKPPGGGATSPGGGRGGGHTPPPRH